MSSLILQTLSLSEAAKLCIDLKMVLLAIADIQTLPSYRSLKSIYELTACISLRKTLYFSCNVCDGVLDVRK